MKGFGKVRCHGNKCCTGWSRPGSGGPLSGARLEFNERPRVDPGGSQMVHVVFHLDIIQGLTLYAHIDTDDHWLV